MYFITFNRAKDAALWYPNFKNISLWILNNILIEIMWVVLSFVSLINSWNKWLFYVNLEGMNNFAFLRCGLEIKMVQGWIAL